MTELRKRMNDAMLLCGLADRTRESYLACVTALAKYYWRSPDQLDAAAIQTYLLHLITEKKLAYDTSITPAVIDTARPARPAPKKPGYVRDDSFCY